MKYLLTVPENKEALSLLNFLLTSQIFNITKIEEDISNATTVQAIEEARKKEGEKFDNVEEFMVELTENQKNILDERLDDYYKNPTDLIDINKFEKEIFNDYGF